MKNWCIELCVLLVFVCSSFAKVSAPPGINQSQLDSSLLGYVETNHSGGVSINGVLFPVVTETIPASIIVSGAGDAEANGTYLKAADYGAYSSWSNASTGWFIAYEMYSENYDWMLVSAEGEDEYLVNSTNSFYPPETGWIVWLGTLPAPALSNVFESIPTFSITNGIVFVADGIESANPASYGQLITTSNAFTNAANFVAEMDYTSDEVNSAVGDVLTQLGAGGYSSLTNVDVIANEWTDVPASFVIDYVSGFDYVSGSTIVYTNGPRQMLLVGNCSLSSGTSVTYIEVGLETNGVFVAGSSSQPRYFSNASDSGSMGYNKSLNLEYGDTIGLVIRANKTQTVTINGWQSSAIRH